MIDSLLVKTIIRGERYPIVDCFKFKETKKLKKVKISHHQYNFQDNSWEKHATPSESFNTLLCYTVELLNDSDEIERMNFHDKVENMMKYIIRGLDYIKIKDSDDKIFALKYCIDEFENIDAGEQLPNLIWKTAYKDSKEL